MTALATLTLYENLFTGQEKCMLFALTSVSIKQVEFKENVRAFPRKRKLSVKTSCPNEVGVFVKQGLTVV